MAWWKQGPSLTLSPVRSTFTPYQGQGTQASLSPGGKPIHASASET